jgi:phage replication O-like protein O
VQKENGYTSVANEILENIIKLPLNGTQFRIIMLLWRETYGFNRKECSLSVSYISSRLSISRRQVQREMVILFECKILLIIKESTYSNSRVISFNKNYDEWRLISHEVTNKTPDDGLDTAPDDGLDTHRKKPLKKPLKKPPIPPEEPNIFEGKSFTADLQAKILEWLKYKKEKKKPYEPIGLKSLLTQIENKLKIYYEADVIELITECMSNMWQGIIWDKLKGKEIAKKPAGWGYEGMDKL